MAVATVAAVVDGVLVKLLGYLEQSFLVKEERPEVIFQVESGVGVFIQLELRPTFLQELTIAQRLHVPSFHVGFVFACGAITAKGENIHFVLHDDINQLRNLIDIRCRNG